MHMLTTAELETDTFLPPLFPSFPPTMNAEGPLPDEGLTRCQHARDRVNLGHLH